MIGLLRRPLTPALSHTRSFCLREGSACWRVREREERPHCGNLVRSVRWCWSWTACRIRGTFPGVVLLASEYSSFGIRPGVGISAKRASFGGRGFGFGTVAAALSLARGGAWDVGGRWTAWGGTMSFDQRCLRADP